MSSLKNSKLTAVHKNEIWHYSDIYVTPRNNKTNFISCTFSLACTYIYYKVTV